MSLFKNQNGRSRALFFVFFAVIVGSLFANTYAAFPLWLKIVYGACIYASLFIMLSPGLSLLKFNYRNLSNFGKFLLWGLFALGAVAIVRGIFAENTLAGNKYITLFFNPIFAPIFFLPVFVLYNSPAIIKNVSKYVIINILVILVISFVNSVSLKILLPACIIFPLVGWRGRIVIILLLLLCLYNNVVSSGSNTGSDRSLLLVVFFAGLAYGLTYIVKNKKLILITCIIISVMPIAFIFLSLYDGTESIFSQLSEQSSTNKYADNTDTRTFLYQEMAVDLTHNDAWVWGKGGYSSYYSAFFDQDNVDGSASVRGMVEVPVLLYLLRSGLVYVAFFLILTQLAVYTAIAQAQSKWMVYIALNLNGFYLNSFIGDFTNFNLTIVCIWIFIGLCLSKTWLTMSDNGLKNFLGKMG